MRLITDLFLVLFVMLQVFCEIPYKVFKWFKREGWKDEEIK